MDTDRLLKCSRSVAVGAGLDEHIWSLKASSDASRTQGSLCSIFPLGSAVSSEWYGRCDTLMYRKVSHVLLLCSLTLIDIPVIDA